MIRLRSLTGFGRDDRGAAAVEFALLLPIILVIYLCVVEFTQAFMVQRRVAHATSQVADITAQSGQVTKATLNSYFDIAQLIMSPFGAAPMQSKVTSVTRMDDKNIIRWSHARGLSPDTVGDEIILPEGLLEKDGDTLIMSQSIYAYDSPYDIAIPGFPDYLSGLTTFSRQFYLRPRDVVEVSCLDC